MGKPEKKGGFWTRKKQKNIRDRRKGDEGRHMHRELGKSMVAVQHLHDACDPAGLNPAVFRKFSTFRPEPVLAK